MKPAMTNLTEYEKVKNVLIVNGPWSVASGHLTANLKIRRSYVEYIYKQDLTQLYAQSGEQISAPLKIYLQENHNA